MAPDPFAEATEYTAEYLNGIELRRLNLPFCEGGRTPLGAAARTGNLPRLTALLKRGVDVDKPDLSASAPIIAAAQANQKAAVNVLLQNGANVNAEDANGRSALTYALYFGHLEVARLLIDHGAVVTKPDTNGLTALDYAEHYLPDKNLGAAVRVARTAGASKRRERNHRVPMRSDPDFVTLETLRRQALGVVFRRALVLAVAISVLGWLDSQFYLSPDLLYALFKAFPAFTSPWVFSFLEFFAGSLLSIVLVPLMAAALIGHPLVKVRREAETEQNDEAKTENWWEALVQSSNAARALSRILKQESIRGFSKLRRIDGPLPAWMRNCNLLLLGLSTCIPATAAVMSAFALSFMWPVYGAVDQLVGGFAGAAIWRTIFILLATIVILRLARGVVHARLIKKQVYRNSLVVSEFDRAQSDGQRSAGPFILYLRSFAQDNKITIGNFSFEATLTYALPNPRVVALRPNVRRLGSVPAPPTTGPWLVQVEELAHEASLVLLIPFPTPGVLLEIGMLREKKLLAKTLFITPPDPKGSKGNIAKSWEQLRSLEEMRELEIPPYLPSGCIFGLDNDGRLSSYDVLGLELEPPPIAAKPEGDRRWGNETSADYRPDQITPGQDIRDYYSSPSWQDNFDHFHHNHGHRDI